MFKSILFIPITLLTLFSLLSGKVIAQAPDCIWAKALGGMITEASCSISVDASGNVYTTGYFGGTIDFDPGMGISNLTSAGDWDIFISKLDGSGNFLWAKSMGGSGNDIGKSITLDSFGNIFTTGYFYGACDFDPGSGIFNLSAPSSSSTAIFISKLDSSGDFVFAKTFYGQGFGERISLDEIGNIYTTGYFYGGCDFDPDIGTFNLFSAGSCDIFISKLNNMGNFVWASKLGGTGQDFGTAIATDTAGNVFTTGSFYGTADFDPGPNTYNFTSPIGAQNAFISKLDSLGNFIFAKALTGSGNSGYSVAIDANENIYTAGSANGIVDYDPGGGQFNLTVGSFIVKLDASGNFLWAKTPGGGWDISLNLDASGNILTTGSFSGTCDFDPGVGISMLTASGLKDIYVSKLNSAGNFIWAKSMGGTESDITYSIAIDANGRIYLTGQFGSPFILFDTTFITNAGPWNTQDIFIVKLDNIATGIENIVARNDISLSPNPASDYLTIAFPTGNKKANITITDITGKIHRNINSITNDEERIEIDTKDFAAGIYFIQIQTVDFIETKKFVVAK